MDYFHCPFQLLAMLLFDHLAAKKSPFSGAVLIPAQLHNDLLALFIETA